MDGGGHPGEARQPIFGDVAAILAEETGVEPSRLAPDATFEALGLTSMDVVTVLSAIEERYDIYLPMDGMIAEARTLGAFVDGVAERIAARPT